MTALGAAPKLRPEIIRGRRSLGGGLKSIGQRQSSHDDCGALPALRGDMPLHERTGTLIREAALKTKSATVGFTTKTAVNSSPEMVRKTSLAVARAKEGDREALRFLYVSYSHNIYGYVRSIVRDDHEAEDVTQHVFAKLMTTIGKYDDRGVPFFAWLLRMARNVAIDHLRANRLTPIENLPESGTELRFGHRSGAHGARGTRRTAPGAARSRRPAPRDRPDPRRDRRPPGADRVVDPWPAPSWPAGSTARVDGA